MKTIENLFLVVLALICFSACSDDDSEFEKINNRRPEYNAEHSSNKRSTDYYKGSVFVNNALTGSDVELNMFFNSRLNTCTLQIKNISFGGDYAVLPNLDLKNLVKQGTSYRKTTDTIGDWVINDLAINFYNNNIILNALLKHLGQKENMNMSLRYEGQKQ